MSHEEAVLQRHPRADSTRVGAIFKGDGSVLFPDEWIIVDEHQELGKGLNEDQAWENAAINLETHLAA